MGSVTAIFFIPLMLVIFLFSTIAGAIKGDNVTKVELPYNPSEGVVWEYDGVDDPLFELIETDTEGDTQIFTFKGISMSDASKKDVSTDAVMDVVFTDENGNELLYYARVNSDYLSFYYKIDFYSPDEYVVAEYTPEEENHIDGAEWFAYTEGENYYGETVTDGKKTFRFLYLPDKTGIEKNRYSQLFTYMVKKDDGSEDVYYEKIYVKFDVETGKYEIFEEDRYFYYEEDKTLYYGDGWVKYNPALLEK